MAYHAATFLMLCFFLSLHACNCRILLPKDFDHGQGLDPESVMETMGSKLQADSENESSMKALWAMTAKHKHPISLQKTRCEDGASHIANTEQEISKPEERILHEKSAEAQEIDALDPDNLVAEDAVVMDYAHPHRKPPIHNEEN